MLERARGVAWRVGFCVALASSVAAAGAQAEPFREDPVAITAAFGAERALASVTALGTVLDLGAADRESAAATAEAVVENDLPLFRFSLESKDGALAAALVGALHSLPANAGSRPDVVAHTQALAHRAVQALEAELPSDAARASVLALVLTGPDGFSDTLDEAAESGDTLELATAWQLLRQGEALWERVRGAAEDAQRHEVQDALGRLSELVPAPSSGQRPAPGSGDVSESDANQIVATVGVSQNASLAPDRDLAALATVVGNLASRGCSAEGAQADQQLAVAAVLYDRYLSATVAMLAPEDDAAIQSALTSLGNGDGSRNGACSQLTEATSRVKATLGG